ncbi:MAG TPA: TetR/AcrR family transcriptional regulator [Myxococcales bacterium]|nr:TetR/AcrR family transcriptional regulator [Myxococcales bacterium]
MNTYSKHEPRLKERQRAEAARAIAAAAEDVFAERGLREARMEEIASRAGVSVGTVYNHFADRDALLRELIESRRAQLARKLDGALAAAAGEPFRDQLRSFCRTVFEHFETHRGFLAIMLQADTAHLEHPSEAMREVKARALALVERGLAAHALKPDGKDLWSMLLLGSIRSLLVHELKFPGKLHVAERADAVVDFFLGGAAA